MLNQTLNEKNTRRDPRKIESRMKEIADWNIETAKQLGEADGVQISVDHLAVLNFLRAYYVKHGWPRTTHEMTEILDREFAEQGGKRYLHKLFPNGPLAQGTRLAGLPTPAYAVDKSFGTTH